MTKIALTGSPLRRCRLTLVALVLFAAGGPRLAAAPADTLVLCPAAFRGAIGPWLAHRREQGHVVHVRPPGADPSAVKRQIRTSALSGNLRFVVLVGDVPHLPVDAARPLDAVALVQPPAAASDQVSSATTPTCFVPAEVNVYWGSEREIASDSPYADLNDDGIPDLAIGRMIAGSPAELTAVVDKILRYEQTLGYEPWRRRVHIVAGLGGFGRIDDAALEATTKTLLTRGIPAGYHTHLTYASWQSPYCPPPAQFREHTIGQFNNGCLFWVYLGHGDRTLLDNVYVPGGSFPILTKPDVSRLRAPQGSPISLLVACYSGAFDAPEASLAEAMLAAPDGPVAVLAASRITLPYGNAVFCSELMQECFGERHGTIGEVVLHAKQSCSAPSGDDKYRGALDLLARLLSPVKTSLAAERREHSLLYNLLGDPLLRIAHPSSIELESPSQVASGGTLKVEGVSPVAGHCTLELVSQRGRLTFVPPKRTGYRQTEQVAEEYADTYRRANDRRYAAVALDIDAGKFSAEVEVPHSAHGPCFLRAYVSGTSQHAIGAVPVSVVRPSH